MNANQREKMQHGTQLQQLQVNVLAQGGYTTSATIALAHLDDARRIRRAGKSAGILFGISIASIAIPLAHYLLVPSFFVASIVTFFVRMKTTDLVSGQVTCPKCQKLFEIEPQPPVWPLQVACHHCRASLTLQPVGQP